MKILTVNLNCCFSKYDKSKIEKILKLLNKYNADIIAVNEADKVTLEILEKKLEGYTFTRAKTEGVENPMSTVGMKGNVKTYVATFVSQKLIDDIDDIEVMEALGNWVRLHNLELKINKNHTLNILNAYVPPAAKSSDRSSDKEEVLGLIKNYAVKHTNKDCIILGDFNTDFSDDFNLFEKLEELNENGFSSILYNSKAPTYKTGVIDHIFLSESLVPLVTSRTQDDSTRKGESAFTDHSALIVDIDLSLKSKDALN